MPGVRIDIDTSQAITSMATLRDGLQKTGLAAKLTEDQTKSLEERFKGKLQADAAAKEAANLTRQIELIGKACGMSSKEIQAMGRQVGAQSAHMKDAADKTDLLRGKMVSLQGVVGSMAAAFGAWKLVEFGKDAALAAARYDTLNVVMEVVGRNAGITKSTMDATTQALQKQGIAMVESRENSIKLVQAGIDLAKSTDLARVAQDAAVIANTNSSESFSRIVTAIQSAQPEMLRTIGINVSFEDSYVKLAAQMGKSTAALTEQEKVQARTNATMEAGANIAGTYEAAMGTAAKQISSFDRYFKDLKTTAGDALQDGLGNSVSLATQKVKDLTEYLKTGEAKDQIAAIGKTGQESFDSLLQATEMAGKVLGTTLSGWNALPAVVQDMGIIAAVVGGAKARAAIALVSTAVGTFRSLYTELKNLGAFGIENHATWADANVRHLEGMMDKTQDQETKDLWTQRIKWFKEYKEGLTAQMAMDLAPVQAPVKPEVGNTVPQRAETFDDLRALAKSSGGGSASLSDETRIATANKAFETRYALSLRMYAMAQGDAAKMAEATAVERDAYHSLGTELESINSKHKKAGDTARKAFYEISEAMNSALGASEAWTGDAWSGKFRALLADLDKDLKAAKTPVEEYWARWEYGAKKAQTEFEQWTDGIRRAGSIMSEIGQLSFDPAKKFAGDRKQLYAEQAQAVKLAGGSQEEIARVNELYQLKEVELREKSLGDMAALDDGYWERRKTGLDAQFEHLKAQGVNEHALAVHMAQERDKLNKEQLEKRLGYEDSFSGYLADRLALQYGLYKDAETQKLELWAKTADAAIELFDGITESFTWAMGQGFGDLLTGKFKDIENYTQQLLAQLKNVFANWLTEMARIAANKYIVYPIMGQIVGTAGSFSAGSTGVPGLNTQGGDGASITDVTTYLGYGKDAYSMFSGGGAGAASLASEAAQGANFVGPSVQLANAGVPGSSSLTTLGALGAGAAAGGIGYMAGGFVRPDNPTASYVGAGAGLAAGTIAGMAGLGALAATGVGALVAIPAALAVGLAQPNTVKSEWSVPNASKSAIMIAGGENTNAAYGVIKQTSSGAFGSSSTSHKSIFGIASPEMAAQQDAAWEAATAGLDGFTKAVGVSSDQLTNAKSSFNFPAIPIPDGMDAEVYRNVANAEAEHTLAQLGMLDAIKAVTKDGEAYIDTLNRLYSTMTSMDAITQATGFDFSRLTAGMDELNAADYVSKFADAAGGIQEVQTALGLLTAHTMDNASRTSAAIANMTGQADSHLVALGVSFEDFWGQMEAAFSGPLDPAIAATWKDAAKLVDQLDTLKKSMDAINSAARQFDASLSARALSAQGFTYQASLVSMLAAQEAELTQARIDGATAAQLSRLAEVQAMEQAALARQRAEQGDSIRSGLASRIATATGDSTYWMTEAVANKQKDYFKLVWDYGYELADMSNRAYDTEIQARLASEAEAARLSREAFALDIRTRKLTLAGKADEAGALKLIADQAEQYRNAIASGLGAGDLDALLQVQRDELTDYWNKLVDDLKSAAAAIRDTVADLRAGDKSPLPVDQRYAMARAQFDAVVAKGMTGDRLAMSDAQSLAPSVLDALMATTTDRDVYAGGFGEVTSALSKLADVLVGVQQSEAAAQQQATYTQNLSRAESAYNQAKTQATEAFRASMEGQIAQGLAYTGAGAGAVTDLAQSGYAYTGGLTVDAYLRANPGKITDYIGWFQQNYGMTGSGQFDAWSTLEKLMGRGITPDGTSDLYSAALAALENLKAVRGYATGGFVTTPQLAMVAENEPELIIPLSKLRPGASSGGGGNGDLVAAIRELKAENAELRREQRQLLLKIESNTYELSQRMGVRADKDGFPVRVVS